MKQILLSIIDTFSKFTYNYILNSKKSDKILWCLKDFINRYGKPVKLHNDNRKEFYNKL